jgi:multiple sugar transport system substrate-binding protein
MKRSVIIAGISLVAAGGAHAVDIKYALWDANQRPAYQQCATDFEKKNPDIKIKINQMGWSDYWTSVTTGFVSGTAPDVFTNHLSRYPEFARNDQLVDLAPLIARDKVATDIYTGDLYGTWGRAGKQYGLPKDWDTIGMIVNLDIAKKAGVSADDLANMTWNPKDGGSFGQIVAKLTQDEAGNNALSPKFDKTKVKVYGYQIPGDGGMMGQTEWSHFAVTNGFKFQDKPWEPKFYYDDPRLAETMTWLRDLIGKGVSAALTDVGTGRMQSADAMFVSGKTATLMQGSWMITYYAANTKFPYAWVPLPKGPSGTRATMLNGLADSIWVGSKHKEQAWKWVKYLGSADCQGVIASYGVVFPAIKGMADKAVEVQKGKGVDTNAFLEMSKATTFLAPMAENGSQVDQVMKTTMQTILMGKAEAAPALKEANSQVNALLNP